MAKTSGCLFQLLGAGQPPDGAGVGGARQRPLAHLGCHIQGVLVQPRNVGLGDGKVKAPGHEGAGGNVEFTHPDLVAAVGGELDQGAGIGAARCSGAASARRRTPSRRCPRRQAHRHRAAPPTRVLALVGIPGGALPESLGMLGIAPEVVVVLAALGHHGNAVGGIENPEDGVPARLEVRVKEFGFGAGVLCQHPLHGPRGVQLLEPLQRVGRLVRRRLAVWRGRGSRAAPGGVVKHQCRCVCRRGIRGVPGRRRTHGQSLSCGAILPGVPG